MKWPPKELRFRPRVTESAGEPQNPPPMGASKPATGGKLLAHKVSGSGTRVEHSTSGPHDRLQLLVSTPPSGLQQNQAWGRKPAEERPANLSFFLGVFDLQAGGRIGWF